MPVNDRDLRETLLLFMVRSRSTVEVTMNARGLEALDKMLRPNLSGSLKTVAAAAFLAGTAALAGAAPVSSIADMAQEAESSVIQVHGFHRHCARDRYGWHRHSEFGERRRCRTWRGRGPRPDFCVRVGPLWVCDY